VAVERVVEQRRVVARRELQAELCHGGGHRLRQPWGLVGGPLRIEQVESVMPLFKVAIHLRDIERAGGPETAPRFLALRTPDALAKGEQKAIQRDRYQR